MWEVVHKVLKNIGESVIAANISVKCDFLPSSTEEDKLFVPSFEHPSNRGEQISESSSTARALEQGRLFL